MGIELEGVKKIESEIVENFNKFFLVHSNLSVNPAKYSCDTPASTVVKETGKAFATGRAGLLKTSFCDLPVSIPAISSSGGESKALKKMMFTGFGMAVFSAVKDGVAGLVDVKTFSLLTPMRKYPHNWKTIFVHLLEKTNLLVR